MKKKAILLILAIILVAGAVFGVYRLATYSTANHVDRISDSTLVSYNRIITAKAIATGHISTRDVLLLHTLTKTPGQDPVVVFYIYHLPEGANVDDYLKLQAQDVTDSMNLEHMGSLTCRIVGNDPRSAYDMRSTFIR